MKEEWRDIEGYEGLYQISSIGKVKRVERVYKKLDSYGNPSSSKLKEIIRKTSLNNSGYESITLSARKYHKKTYLVHRLVAIAFLDVIPSKLFVNHKNSNKLDNSLINLEWCSHQENMKHMNENVKRNMPAGENCHFAKRKKEDILDIRLRRSNGETIKSIASIYGASSGYISDVVNRNLWKHIK